MKYKKGVFLLLILLVIPYVFSLDIILKKDTYSPRETLQAEIQGNFLSLKPENILIYEENKAHPEPVIQGLTKQNNVYYFYAVLPNKDRNVSLNYSIRIENAEYIEYGKIKSSTLVKNFKLLGTNESYISINPGFVLAKKEFDIRVTAINSDKFITADLDLTGESKNLTLFEEDEKILRFSMENPQSNMGNLKIDNYNIPVFVLDKINPITPYQEYTKLNLLPTEIYGTVVPGKIYTFKIILENSGNKNISNISFKYDSPGGITPNTIDNLDSGESSYVNLTIPVSADTKDKMSGEIIVFYENTSVIIPIYFNITENETNIDLNNTGINNELSCASIGNICLENQECLGVLTSSLEGPCCKGDCVEPTPVKSYKWQIIGVVLLVLLLVIVVFIYMNSKKRQKQKTTEEYLKEGSKRYQDRMKGIEVKGRLDSV